MARKIVRTEPIQPRFSNLNRGDIIRNTGSGETYIVTNNFKSFVMVVKTLHVSNPDEWVKITVED